MTSFDATARINLDISSFSRAAQQATSATGGFTNSLNQLGEASRRLSTIDRQRAADLNRTLQVYQRMTSSVRSFSAAINTLSQSGIRASSASQRFNTVLTTLGNSLANVQGRSEAQFANLNRTVTLYERMARAVSTYASALQRMSQTTQQAEIAQVRLNTAQSQSAAAAARAQTAQSQAAVAAERAARAQQSYAGATQQSHVANLNVNTSLFSLRSALTDLEGVYRRVQNVILLFAQTTASVAIEYEAAFAQILRVTQETEAQAEDLRESFRELSTEIPVAFEELAQVGVRAAQIGIAREEMQQFTEVVVMFSRTTGIADEQVTLLLGRVMQMADVPIDQVENLGSAISELGSNSAATDYEVLRVTESIAAVATQTGFSTEMLTGMSSALASLGIRAELSRGALTRVFNSVTQAVESTDQRTHALSETMGLNQTAMRELMDTDVDQFYLQFFQSLNQVDEAGGNLNSTLREMGIINSRDINVITRLASNYDLLAEQVDLSSDAFARGDFLREESARIFETVEARIQTLTNTMRNLFDTAGRPLLSFIAALLEAGQAVLQFVDNSAFLSGTLLPIAGVLATLTAGYLAWRIALVATSAAVVAYRQVGGQLGTQKIGLRTVIDLLTASQTRYTAATNAATTATAANAAAHRANTAAAGASVAAAGRQAQGFGAVAGAAARGAASFGLWGAAVSALTVGGVALVNMLNNQGSAAERAVEASREATGGVEAFTDAIRQDTAAGSDNNQVYREYTTTKDQVVQADIEAAEALNTQNESRIRQIELTHGGRDALREMAQEQGSAGIAAQGHLDTIERLEQQIRDTTDSIEEQTHIIGDLAAEQVLAANEALILETGMGEVADAADLAARAGVNLGEIMDGFLDGSLDPVEELGAGIEQVDENIENLSASIERNAAVASEVEAYEQQIEGLETFRTLLEALQIEYSDLDESMQTNARVQSNNLGLLGDSAGAMDIYGDEAAAATESLDGMNDAMADNQQAMRAMSQTLSSLGTTTDAWSVLVDEANGRASDSWTETQGQVEEFFGSSAAAFEEFRSQMRENAQAQADFARNMVEISEHLGADVAEAISAMGDDAAAVADLVVENMGNAGEEGMESIRNEILAGTPGAIDALSEASDAMARVADTHGGEIGSALSSALGSSIDAALAEGGDANVWEIYETIQLVAEAVEANPVVADVLVDELEAVETLDDLVALVNRINEDGDLDPVGEAVLHDGEFRTVSSQLWRDIMQQNDEGRYDPEAVPQVYSSEFLEQVYGLGQDIDQRSDDGEWDPEATPQLNSDPIEIELDDLENQTSSSGDQIEDNLDTTPHIDQSQYDRDRQNMVANAQSTGNSIVAALTRTATVNVRTAISGVGSWISGALGFASGGWVSGPGGSTEDRIPAFLSDGEYVVNARSAQEFGPLLEAINSSGSATPTSSSEMMAPMNLGGNNTSTMRPSVQTPDRLLRGQGPAQGAGVSIVVHNTYPRSEPTSTTINRSLAYAAALDGV